MEVKFLDRKLNKIYEKVKCEQRLDFKDGILLYESHDLIGVGRIADYVRKKKYKNIAFYIYNQHLNYTNVCKNRCLFCAYAVNEADKNAYTYTMDDVREQLLSRIKEPVDELHVVGGLNLSLPFEYYINLLQTIKSIRPDAVIKAFTAVEIDYLSNLSNLSIHDVIKTLVDAGLGMMPGGGAEVMSNRVRQKLFPRKIGKDRWLEIQEAVHNAGLKTNATMLYGHIETLEERVDHLISLRELQDRTGGFSAFIPLAFHSENTKLSELPPTTAFDDLKNISIARLMLDNFDHIKAYWVMIGEKLAQLALSFGADDLDGTIIEEKITHTAGAKSAKGLTCKQMELLISSAGFLPVRRNSFYNSI